jgi:F-type H+-transporting ATPase subunit delta
MVPRGIAKRYATALMNAALKLNAADDINGDAAAFRRLLADNPALKDFLMSPQILTEDKKAILEKALKGRANEMFVQFLHLLIDKKRFWFVEEVLDGYGYLYERHKGIVEVRAITAISLDERLKQKTIEKLEQETGKKIRLTEEVDPKILGGMVLVMEDKIIDGSIRFRLEKLVRKLDEIRV